MSKHINSVTIYHGATDFEGLYVARRYEDETPTDDHLAALDLLTVRNWAVAKVNEHNGHTGAIHFDRSPEDDPVIVETWM